MSSLRGLCWTHQSRPLIKAAGYKCGASSVWVNNYCYISRNGLRNLQAQKAPDRKTAHGLSRIASICARKSSSEKEDLEKFSEALDFFRGRMDQLKKPLSRSLIKRLDMNIWHGVPVSKPGAKGIVFQFFEKVKKEYPKNVVLVKVGEFYECWGFDAVILVEHAGLNPMGREGIPRAGTPIKNLRRTLMNLVEESGFSCVVCEEMPEAYQYGKRSSPKTRFIGGVVTPASPMYTYNMVEDNGESDLGGYKYLDGKMEGMNIIGLSIGVRGLNLMEVCLDLRHVFTIDGLHHDAVISRLLAGGFSPPLYLHSSFQAYPELKRQILTAASHSGAAGANITKFDGVDPVQALIQAVRHDHMIGGRMEFEVVERSNAGRPLPLFLSAAKQLGLAQSEGTPSLSDIILPADAPKICQNFLHRLLLHPTPQSISISTQNVIRYMISENCCGIASMSPLSGAKIARFIDDEEASAHLLADTALMCKAVSQFIQGAQHGDSADNNPAVDVSKVAAFEIGAGSPIDPEVLSEETIRVYDKISRVVRVEENAVSNYTTPSHFAASDKSSVFLEDEAPFQVPSRDYFTSNEESWRGIVLPDCNKEVELAYREVDRTALLLQATLFRDYQAALEASQGMLDSVREKRDPVSVVYDINNNAIWLKVGSVKTLSILQFLKDQFPRLPKSKFPLLYESLEATAEYYVNNSEKYKGMSAKQVAQSWIQEIEAREIEFEHPRDRNGVVENKRLSTVGVEAALNAYRNACAQVHSVVFSELRALSRRLKPLLSYITYGSAFYTVLKSLEMHSVLHFKEGWVLPTYSQPGSSLIVQGLKPYWMACGRRLGGLQLVKQTTSEKVQTNSFEMDGIFLLTGPNMGGKSTLSRSASAAALLGLCGLLVPCSEMHMPFFDAIMMRGASGDSPLEGKSTFALEMKDLKAILDHTSSKSFVAIDELGKGTESDAGSCVAAATLEIISQRGALGIFATHFHEVDGMNLNFDRVRRKKMEIALDENDRQRPTWRMCDGISRDSLALEVARENSVPEYFLQRARELYEMKRQSQDPSFKLGTGHTSLLVEDALPEKDNLEEASASSLSMDKVEADTAGDGPHDGISYIKGLMESTCRHELGDEIDYRLVQIQAGTNPPPYVTLKSCVYILYIDSTDEVYCGETDDLRGRITTHRSGKSNVSAQGPISSANFVALAGLPGKSAARKLEVALIQNLSSTHFKLLGTGDISNTNFGVAYKLDANSQIQGPSTRSISVPAAAESEEDSQRPDPQANKSSYDPSKDEIGLGGNRFTGGIL